jgi:hypothetical protein
MSKKLIDSKADILPNPATLVFVECGLLVMIREERHTEIVD